MTPEVASLIDEASRLESLAMAIYTRLASCFREDGELHRFWMSMARHEAGHVGALALIRTLLEESADDLHFEVDDRVTREAAVLIQALHREAGGVVPLDRAFAISLELETLELEDLVLDLTCALSDPAVRLQAEQMLLHDLSDLSLMIEKRCTDDELLARADALVDSRVGTDNRRGYVRRA